MPEQVLWLAVIERAMMDAIWPTTDLSIKHRHSLQWFFFKDEPQPFNLAYICEAIFDYPDAAKEIVKRLEDLKIDPEPLEFARSRRYRGYY